MLYVEIQQKLIKFVNAGKCYSGIGIFTDIRLRQPSVGIPASGSFRYR
jgi:hypothetical protein